jgi:hypothetical protein
MKLSFTSTVIAGLITLASFSAFNCWAHEGHSVPGVLPSTHGGTAIGGKDINIEYITNDKELLIYPLSHDGKDLSLEKVKISGTAKAPKGKNEILLFNSKDGVFMTQVDFQKNHRVEINIVTELNQRKSEFKFQMEKQ